LAQPPDINETFLREVDENLRRDRLREAARKNAKWIIAGLVLFLAASGGIIWWQQHRVEQSQAQVERLAEIYRNVGSGGVASAPQQLDELSDSGSKAVRASAEFTAAAVAIQKGDTKSAIARYRAIAEDSSHPQPYRDMALIRQTALEFDQLSPDQVIARLAPLAKPGNPWFGTASEMTGLAMIKQGRKDQAGRVFAALARDRTVPDDIRQRAVQIAGSLGVDVSTALAPPAQWDQYDQA
jgi:hypothetical protein